MNVKQSYFDFLAAQGAKEKVQAIIAKGIEKWKKEPAYEYEPSVDPYTGDYSGEVNRIGDKTIGDICKTDIDVLKAYTGRSTATYTSHCGLSFGNVAEDISEDINSCLSDLRHDFIRQNEKELVEYFNDDIEQLLSKKLEWIKRKYFDLPLCDAGYDYITDFLSDEVPHYDWMAEQFPEYMVDDDICTRDYLFDILS